MSTKTRNILLAIPILGVLLIGGGYAGYRGYTFARQTRLISQARSFIDKSEEKKAILCLQRALRHNSKDARACRLMAELAERAGSPAALIWRSRVVELAPGSTDDRLALARTAMSSRDLISATNALAGVSEAGKKTAGFHNLAGSVAAMTGREGEAETHFLEVSRLEPTNAAARLNLAVVRLHSTNALVLNEARTALSHLRAEPSVRCQALRELVGDAARFNKTNDALALSQELVQQTNCLFSDHLLRLDLMRVGKPSEFKPALAVFEREAGTNVVTISELATWQLTRLGPAETLTWLRTLPRTAQTNPPVAMLVAECQGRLSDWKGLQTSLDHQDWGEMDFTRHAYETLALRGQDLRAAAQTEWELALKAANGQKQRLVMLLRFATQWKWESDSEEILRTIASQYPAEKWAFQTLFHSLFVGGRTRPMMMLLSEQMKRSPSDLVVKNNLAMTALLLEAAEFKPHDLAREIYQLDPTNYAGTYAFSLYVQGKNAEALKVMQRLKPAELEKPSNAGYYGLILKANGDRAKARAYLEWASKAQLLPEEKKLFDRAKAGI